MSSSGVGSPVEQDWKRLVHELRQEILQQTSVTTLQAMHEACWALGSLAQAQRDIFKNAGSTPPKKGKK